MSDFLFVRQCRCETAFHDDIGNGGKYGEHPDQSIIAGRKNTSNDNTEYGAD
jgi:hypothetical protein